jgi:leucyl-tRNA synthetase
MKKMGCKYTIKFTRNGTCDYEFDRQTKWLVKALWYLFTLGIKYPIIDFQIRRGYVPCEKCTADWCEKSPVFKEEKV